MKKLFFTTFFLFCFSSLFAYEKDKESTLEKSSYTQLMSKHANNDTCKALIEVFFEKRKQTAIAKMSFLPISTGVAAIAPPVGLALMAASSPVFISGLITNSRFSKKKLNQILTNYKNYNSLSKRHKKLIQKLFDIDKNRTKEEKMYLKKEKMRSIALK